MVIGESGFEARAARIIVSGYSGVCFFEIKFSADTDGSMESSLIGPLLLQYGCT